MDCNYIIIISGDVKAPLPADIEAEMENFSLIEEFGHSDDKFRFKTFVSVYRRIL
jgi:hypothetical protein